MSVALTRPVSLLLDNCELTHIERNPIDIYKAISQHKDYENSLKKMGYSVRQLPETPHLPDGVFVEDTAVVFPEFAIITRPGAESRREETTSMAEVLKEYRDLKFIIEPGTVDGGDVLTLGKNVYIGLSDRSNKEGIRQFSDHLKPYGYQTTAVQVSGCLHLKTAIAVIEEDLLLINPRWINPDIFDGIFLETVHPDEPYGANVMRHQNRALSPAAFKKTNEWLSKRGYDVIIIDQSEIAKAEAGLSCCSVLVD